MRHTGLFLILLLIFSTSYSQITKVTPLTQFTVIENGDTLKNPFAGGISLPMFSQIDINNDGTKDLFIFDKDGSKTCCFINGGTPGKIDYTYAPEYSSKFPAFSGWVLLRDYDGDNKEDIFTMSWRGFIDIYKNTSIGNNLTFTMVVSNLEADRGGFMAEISTSIIVPEIMDIDSDGDLDIFTYERNERGDAIYYYKNYAMELSGSADTLSKYRLEKMCWGRFTKHIPTCTIELQSTTDICANGNITHRGNIQQKSNLDNGSSMLIFDGNGDGNYDILIGNGNCNNMYFLANTNNNTEAIMTSVDYSFPSSHPIDIYNCPAAFHIDVNNDNKKDLIAVVDGISRPFENNNSTWLYLNTGTITSPDFQLNTKSFLQEEMIDVQQNASPLFFDYDQDGKVDLLIANSGNATYPILDSASITLYKNTGTNEAPVYELISRDYSNISQYHFINLSMTTGDIDKDNDDDLLLGDGNGVLHYMENNAAQGAPAHFVLHTPYYQNIDIGRYSLPNLVDVNNDQKLDLLLGGRAVRDTINLYLDTANTNPLPEFKLTNKLVGGIKQTVPSSTGASLYFNQNYDSNGTNSLFVTKGAMIYFYDSIPGDLSGVFKKTDSIYLNIGNAIRITMQDLNGDGKKELIAGTSAGGLTAYEIEYVEAPVGIGHSRANKNLFSVYPNPSSQKLTIAATDKESDISKVEVYDMLGRMVFMKDEVNHINITIPTGSLQNGNYVLRIYSNSTVATKLVMIQH